MPTAKTRALGELELLLKIPYSVSPGWLRIDANLAPPLDASGETMTMIKSFPDGVLYRNGCAPGRYTLAVSGAAGSTASGLELRLRRPAPETP